MGRKPRKLAAVVDYSNRISGHLRQFSLAILYSWRVVTYMRDHPVLGAVLFIIGAIFLIDAYAAPVTSSASLLLGYILTLNGALWLVLGSYKSLSKRRAGQRAHQNFPKLAVD